MSLTAGFVSIINQNLQNNKNSEILLESLEKFSLAKAFPMRVEAYVDHFLYQLDLDEKLLSSAYILLEPFFKYLSLGNLHKLVFTAMVLSYKAYTERPAKNSTLEKIGVLKSGELIELERKMLDIIDWQFCYSRTEDVCEKLLEEGKVEESEVEDYDSLEDHETDFTEHEDCDSFSELSAFF